MKILNQLAIVLFLELTILCVIVSFRFINIQTTMMLLIFNALFTSVTFQLKGAVNKKLCLLALGNATGLLWNFLFHSFTIAATASFGQIIETLYTVLYPFLNSFWVVSFWSLSLTALHRPESSPLEFKY